jgi:hypothetical protein
VKQAVIESDFMHKDFRCLVIARPMGYRCGYVGVPKGPSAPFSCFGDDGLWWIGFDCGHICDGVDPSIIDDRYKEAMSWNTHEFRTREYVEAECKKLAEQLGGVR